MATVVVLPDTSWGARSAVIDGLPGAMDVHGVTATEVCGDLVRRDPEPPLIVIAHGSSCGLLPAVALAQRTAHRRVGAYVVVDPVAPASTDTWPDAPVHVITADAQIARMAGLRGWSVSDDDVVTLIRRISSEIV